MKFLKKKRKRLKKTRKEEMNTAIQYLNREPNKYIKDYKNAIAEKIRTIDIAREENFKKVFPLLNKNP